MVDVVLNHHRYLYDAHSLVKAFFQEEEVRALVKDAMEEEPEGNTKYHKEINGISVTILQSKNNDLTFNIRLAPEEEENLPEEPDSPVPNASTDGSGASGKTEKNRVKQLLYEALTALTGRTLPWGALTGIRPTKIATTMLAEGADDNTIISYLNNVHYVSPEKARLSIEIARRERSLLSSYDYASGYTLYVGIPFCPTRCSYCSFAAYPLLLPGNGAANGHKELLKSRYASRVEAYMKALEHELEAVAQMMRGVRLDTVYIGGGTPTALPHLALRRLLQFLREQFDFSRVKEFTVEAGRPDSILDVLGKLTTLKEFRVDRICVNPQTFSQKTLDLIGRGHTVEETIEAYHLARDAGFDNINMDIILGLPGETPDDVSHTMEEIAKLAPDDLTVHSLAIKRGSRMAGEDTGTGVLSLASSAAEEMGRIAEEGARAMGLVPYYLYRQKNMTGNMENTGYARPGREGLTNILGMEEVHSVLACGCGAVTKRVWNREKGDPCYGKIARCGNVRELDQYIARVDEMIGRKRKLFEEEQGRYT